MKDRGEAMKLLDGRDDYHKGLRTERKRIIKIIKSHIELTYPINCEAIIKEINGDGLLGENVK